MSHTPTDSLISNLIAIGFVIAMALILRMCFKRLRKYETPAERECGAAFDTYINKLKDVDTIVELNALDDDFEKLYEDFQAVVSVKCLNRQQAKLIKAYTEKWQLLIGDTDELSFS